MIHLQKFDDFRKINSLFLREHDKIVKRFDISFTFLEGGKIPLICLYNIVDVLFKNNSKILKTIDIILLTLTGSTYNHFLVSGSRKKKQSPYLNEFLMILKKRVSNCC